MRLNKYSLLLLMALGWSTTFAQTIKSGYVDQGYTSPNFLNAVNTFNSTYKVTDDDNFYISRVKSKARFRNVATQVQTKFTDENDKRLLCWLPWEDDEKGVGQNALPHGNFDTEVFSMWSYVHHWGDWNAALGRVPAALLDVAHKNGVAVSGTGVIANGPIASTPYDSWISSLSEDLGAKTANLMYYFGDNGLGYNSEFSTTTNNMNNLIAYHKRMNNDLIAKGDVNAESMWYEGTGDGGNISYNNSLGGVQGLYGTGTEPVFSMMTDYQSMTDTKLSGIVSVGNTTGRTGLYCYAGCNIQTGISGGWQVLANYNVSIGLWGAHKNNMFFQQRYRGGNAPSAMQRTYLLSTERWFGGGHRNPVLQTTPFQNLNYSHTNIEKNPGMCSMMSARSTLQWDLSTEPFVSFFNLGNGTFLNYKGVRANNNEWANVGVQDYLPTWRFWFHNDWLGRTTSGVPANLDAQFIWTDAYVGGSCLEISGSTMGAYLHLFKTQFALQAGDVITVRYKLAAGSGDVDLAFSALGSEDAVITGSEFNLIEASQHHDSDVWVEKTFTVGDGNTLAGKTIAAIALHFNSLTDATIYLGELSIVRGTAVTPAAPTDLRTSVLYNGITGIDAKLLWEMPGKKAAPEPTYNLDVNTGLFKIYAQIDDNEPILQALTTSWAGFSFQTPTTGSKVRFGVAAVSTDFASESATTWGDWFDISSLEYDYNDNIQISKSTLKPDEEFTISYVDPAHEAADWSIVDKDGTVKASGNGTSITASLSDEGIYDLIVDGYTHADGVTATAEKITYGDYITISPEDAGALPEIYTFTLDGKTEGIKINKDEDHTLAFTARDSDGKTSRGINLQSRYFGGTMTSFGLPNANTSWGSTATATKVTTSNTKSWTLSYWLKPAKLSGAFFRVVNTMGEWPRNNWGRTYGEINEDGSITYISNSSGSHTIYGRWFLTYDAQLAVDKWTHIAIVNEYKADYSLRFVETKDSIRDMLSTSAKNVMLCPRIYINGKKMPLKGLAWWSYLQSSGDNSVVLDMSKVLKYEYADYASHIPNRRTDMVNSSILIGGPDRIGGVEGTLDHVMLFSKALSDEEVVATMGDMSSAPDGIIGYWDFDNNEIDSDYGVKPLYGTSTAKVYLYDNEAGSQEGQNILTARPLDETAGYPFLAADYDVKTTATWDVPGADIKSTEVKTGSSVKAAGTLTGTATVNWPMEAVRDITLTLTNDYGSDSKTITAVQVGEGATGIDDIWADQDKLQIVQAQDFIVVRVGEAGQYEFRLYAADGRTIDQQADRLNAGNSVTLALPNQGVYILSIVKDGKLYNGYKFIRQ